MSCYVQESDFTGANGSSDVESSSSEVLSMSVVFITSDQPVFCSQKDLNFVKRVKLVHVAIEM